MAIIEAKYYDNETINDYIDKPVKHKNKQIGRVIGTRLEKDGIVVIMEVEELDENMGQSLYYSSRHI